MIVLAGGRVIDDGILFALIILKDYSLLLISNYLSISLQSLLNLNIKFFSAIFGLNLFLNLYISSI
jgi:hypothetical protein